MIQVVTAVELIPDCPGEFLRVLNEIVPKVRNEEGCLAYEPMVDVESGMPTQGKLRQNTIALVEAWATMDALHAHLRAPHMAGFREAAQDYVLKVSHQVLQPLSSWRIFHSKQAPISATKNNDAAM